MKKAKVTYNPANIYLFKVNNRNTRKKLTINFEHISHLVLLLTLTKQMSAGNFDKQHGCLYKKKI